MIEIIELFRNYTGSIVDLYTNYREPLPPFGGGSGRTPLGAGDGEQNAQRTTVYR